MGKENGNESKCVFCQRKKIEDRIIKHYEEEEFDVFIPKDPQIFGHLLLTRIGPPCLGKLENPEKELHEKINILSEGTMTVAKDFIKRDTKIDKVYIVVMGESESFHFHYHLIPRYGFLNDNEIDKWTEKYGIEKGSIEWRQFYARPTLGFRHFHGYRYLGEMERTFNEAKDRFKGNPPDEILLEMKKNVEELFR